MGINFLSGIHGEVGVYRMEYCSEIRISNLLVYRSSFWSILGAVV